ncbi:hypothetical protein RhiJN_27094 [Ceratobasidium sp. AG-Ba]|nr:hypothetical protein RhiJN_27094 [Ceratobasidium sp. AG-Ba]
MTDRTYARVREEASMTGYERYVAGRIKAQINEGLVPTIMMPERRPPRREGLRGVQYEFGRGKAPKPLNQAALKTFGLATTQGATTSTKNPPGLDSSLTQVMTEPTFYVRKNKVPSTSASEALVEPDLDETGSQADTVLDSASESSSSEDEDENNDAGEDEGGECSGRQENGGSKDGEGEYVQEELGNRGIGDANNSIHGEPTVGYNNPFGNHMGHTVPGENSCSHQSGAPLSNNGIGIDHGHANHFFDASSADSGHLFGAPNPIVGHPFGNAEPLPSLPDLSPEDALLLSASFPTVGAWDSAMDIDFTFDNPTALGLQSNPYEPPAEMDDLGPATISNNSPSSSLNMHSSLGSNLGLTVVAATDDIEAQLAGDMAPCSNTNKSLGSSHLPMGYAGSAQVVPDATIGHSPIPYVSSTPVTRPEPTTSSDISRTTNPISQALLSNPARSHSPPRYGDSTRSRPPGPRIGTPRISSAPLIAPSIEPQANLERNRTRSPAATPIQMRRHSTQVTPQVTPRVQTKPLLRMASSNRLARGQTSSTPNRPAIGVTPARSSFNDDSNGELEFHHDPLSPFDPRSDSGEEIEPLASRPRYTSDPRACRNRTPPPLVRIHGLDQLTAEELVARSNGFLVTGNIPQDTHRVAPIPLPSHLRRDRSRSRSATPIRLESGLTFAAPTQAEFLRRRAEEARKVQNARKTSNKASAEQEEGGSGPKSIGSFPILTQELIFLVRAGMQYDYLHAGPFYEDEEGRFIRAKGFAQQLVNHNVDEIVNEECWQTMRRSNGQLRTAGQDEIKLEAARYYKVEQGDTDPINDVLDQDGFTFPGENLVVEDQFNLEIMVIVIAILYFGTPCKLGFLCMDKLLEDDDPEATQKLLELVTSEDEEPLTILDQSPEAQRGPSLAVIAFAAIRHALERLKVPSIAPKQDRRKKNIKGQKDKQKEKGKKAPGPPRVEFNETNYGTHWKRYVRALACHPHLGTLRRKSTSKVSVAMVAPGK